jgi:hypothetical protein
MALLQYNMRILTSSVVRVSGYRTRGPGSIPGVTRYLSGLSGVSIRPLEILNIMQPMIHQAIEIC